MGEAIRAVVWLALGHDYPTGKVQAPSRFLRNLRALASEAHLPSAFPVRVDYMGLHTCELCRNHHGSGELLVPSGDLVFIAPAMIEHYVEVHEYLPPPEFVAAVNFCPLPSTPEYQQMMRLAVRGGPGGLARISTTW